MARNDETGVPEFLIPFQVDRSWYERYWWHDSAPRKPGIFAFFRRILSQLRLTRRQDAQAEHSPSNEVARPSVAQTFFRGSSPVLASNSSSFPLYLPVGRVMIARFKRLQAPNASQLAGNGTWDQRKARADREQTRR